MVVDSTTTDNDVLNLAMNSYASTQAVVTNIETINATSAYASVGFDAANATGTKTLNLAAGIDGAVATAEGVSSSKVAKVVAGNNVGTLRVNSVNAVTTGTGTSVAVDAGKAATVAVGNTGATATDTYDVTVAAGSTTTLAAGTGGTDTFTLNLSGGAYTLTIANGVAGTADINVLNIVAGGSAASTITLSSATHELAGSSTGDAVNIRGTQNVRIIGNGDVFSGTDALNGATFTKAAGAGTVTLESNAALAAASFFNRAAVDRLVLSTAATARDITINDNTELAMTFANGSQVYNVGNTSTAGTIANGGGTLKLSLEGTSSSNAVQTSITTGAAVGTTVITNSTRDSTITTLNTHASAATIDTVVVSGSKNLTVGTWTASAAEVFTASGLTGNLILTVGATGASVIGGSGADTITGGAQADSLNGGAGADRIVGTIDAAADTMTGGSGSDVFVVGDITGQDTITDFSVNDATRGTDVIALSGALLTDQLVNGAGADVANGTAAKVLQVSGSTTAAAADNVFVLTGTTFATAAAVATAVQAGGTRVITLGGNSAANNDYLLVWSDGTDSYVSAYLNATGTATALAGGTMTQLVKLTGLASVDTLTSANFAFVA